MACFARVLSVHDLLVACLLLLVLRLDFGLLSGRLLGTKVAGSGGFCCGIGKSHVLAKKKVKIIVTYSRL